MINVLNLICSGFFCLAGMIGDEPGAGNVPAKDTQARAAFSKLEKAKNWPVEREASQQLAALGDSALDVVRWGAEYHEESRVRRACYELLTDPFAKDERGMDVVLNCGLSDKDSRIRYLCAFKVGELRVYRGHRRLRIVMQDQEADELTRTAAAKSLAELGEADVLPKLYQGATHDLYMMRHMASIGLKALTGKSVDDFEGYKYGEGAFVSGGREAMMAFDAVTEAEKKAKRYAAVAAYFRWLKQEKPELYKHVSPSY